jgi:hypothetical protein
MRIETKEDILINELRQVHESIESYIDDTLALLIAHNVSEQDAKKGIIKRFKKILKVK